MVIEPNKPTLGLRLIAIFEGVKGALGLALGIALHLLAGSDAHPFLQSIVQRFHLADEGHSPHFIVSMLTHRDSLRLEVWTVLAVLYAALRFTEAYGLWLARRWGEWLALVGVALYVPFEIYALTLGVTVPKVAVLLVNLVFVAYLAMILRATRRKRAIAAAPAGTAPAKWNTNATKG